MKKILIVSIFFAFLAFVPHALAQTSQGFVPLAGIPGLTQGVQATQGGIASFLNNLYKFLIGAAAVLAVIMIIWGGLEIATNKDNVSKILDSKGRIYNAIFGLILVLLPVLVFSIINPSILNLSINMSPINLSTPAGSGGGSQNNSVDQASGCRVNGTPGILQVASCSTDNQATTWGQQSCTDGNLSITSITNSSNGVPTYVATCTGKQGYVFIYEPGFFTFIINRLQPLAQYPSRPNNGNDAITFASICHAANVGFKTCVSDDPSSGLHITYSSVPCQLTKNDPSYGTSWKCYPEMLTCEDVSLVGNLDTKCADSPSWTPFQ